MKIHGQFLNNKSINYKYVRKSFLFNHYKGSLFKEAGYTTAVFGKDQPLHTIIRNTDLTQEEIDAEVQARKNYKFETFGKDGIRDPGQANKNFFQPGHYKQIVSPQAFDYDYSFVSTSPCCQPAGFFENGQGLSPFDRYAIQGDISNDNLKFS